MNDEFGIYYRADLARQRVDRARRALLWRVGWMLLLLLLGVAGWFAFPDQVGPSAPWYLGATAIVGTVFGSRDLVLYLGARSEAARVTPGLAIGLNRSGILLGADWLTWPEVGSLVILPGRFGASDRLVGRGRDGRSSQVLVGCTDVMPASLNSAVVALSAGRARVDLSRLDS